MNKITLADQLVGEIIASGTIAAAVPCITPRRRARLNGSCAVAALLALPAAMSVGVMLSRPAQAQTFITNNKYSTVILGNTTNYPDGNPFTIEGSTVNAPTGDGVYGNAGTQWTLTNYGVIIGGTANGVGFGSGGTIVNSQSSGIGGTITGATDGVYVTGSYGVVGNIGLIQGSANSGVDLLAGGTLYNAATLGYTGTITGGADGVAISNATVNVTNAGTITGAAGDGVRNSAGGYVNNIIDSSVISGTVDGIQFTGASGSVGNQGTITGATGAGFDSGGSVDNYGIISGTTYGVSISGGQGVVANEGQTDGAGPGTISGDTAVLITSGNAFVINTPLTPTFAGQATIAGSTYGVQLTGADGTVVNYGLISANGQGGVAVAATQGGVVYNYSSIIGNGAGIVMSGGGDVLNVGSAVISGATGVGIDGGGSVASSILNAGLITGTQYGVSLSGGPNTGTLGSGANGTLSAVFNNGTISQTATGATGNAAGIFLSGVGEVFNGVYFNNGGTLTIGNTLALINGATYGVLASGSSVAVGNAGIIVGTAGSGIKIDDAGFVYNLGTVLGGQTGVTANGDHSLVLNIYDTTASIIPLISGGSDGVLMTGTAATMVNIGTVIGNDNSTLTPSGTGVSLANGGGIFNAPSASMFAVISGADYGVHVSGLDGYLVNAGYVVATNGSGTAVAIDNGGYVSNTSIGTIQGGSIGVAVGTFENGTQAPFGLVANEGLITGGEFGVSMAGYGIVNNTISGYIRGDQNGVYIAGLGASVSNLGTITTQTFVAPLVVAGIQPFGRVIPAAGVSFANGGYVHNGGYIYGANIGVAISGGVQSFVTNTTGGYIKGGTIGVDLSGDNDELDNSGAIVGYLHGAVLNNGGAVYNDGTIIGTGTTNFSDGVILAAGGYVLNTGSGVIAGNIYGIDAVDAGQLTMINDGTIAALGSAMNGPNAYLGTAVYAANGGTLTNGSLGLITASGNGIVSKGTMNVTNEGGIIGDNYGVLLAAGSVINSGLINGNFIGVIIQGTNASVSNLAGGEIYGGKGVILGAAGAQLYNAGGINGGKLGVELYDGGSVYNKGTIQAISNFSTAVSLAQGGTVTNAAGGVIYGYNYGVRAAGAPITVLNDGMIGGYTVSTYLGTTYRGVGVYSKAGGTLTNGTLGVIAGYDEGVFAYGTMGVTNHGTIFSARYGVSVDTGSVFNDGYISAGESGVYVNNGNVTNAAGGTIIGYRNGVFTNGGGADSVGNAGTIVGSGDYGTGVYLEAGGTVTNTGLITGGEYGVFAYANSSTVINDGTITQTYAENQIYAAVYLNAGGTVFNMAAGTITGVDTGVIVSNAAGTIINAGVIDGFGYDGVSLNRGGYLANRAGATIQGEHMGVYTGAAGVTVINYGLVTGAIGDGVSLYKGGSLFNSGTITGGYAGVYDTGLGSQVQNAGYISGAVAGVVANGGSIINQQTASIIGSIAGVIGGIGGVDVTNAGTIVGFGSGGIGVSLPGGGSAVTNQEGGVIYGTQVGVQLEQAGTVLNAGTIVAEQSGAGTYAGVALLGGGYLYNAASGTIGGYTEGVRLSGGVSTLFNKGVIGGYIYGVSLRNAGTSSVIINAGTVYGAANDSNGVFAEDGTIINRQGGVITGQYAVDMYAGTLLNDSQITGGYSGVTTDGSVVVNFSTGTITGGVYGVGLFADGASTLANAGTITGNGSFGVTFANDGTLVNYTVGVISGGSFGLGAHGTVTVTNYGQILGTADTGLGINYGTVVNEQSGTIIGGDVGVSSYKANITNAGSIGGGNGGVGVYSAHVDNLSTGRITGGVGVGVYGSLAVVTNAGTIIGTSLTGVNIIQGGTVTNYAGGFIYGFSDGVSAASFISVDNSGTITDASGDGVLLNNGGTVLNRIGGEIYGEDTAIDAENAAATITNAGHINGYYGINLQQGGAVYNMAGATIASSGDAVDVDNAPGLVINNGVIIASGSDYSGIQMFGTSTGSIENTGLISGGEYGVVLGGAGFTLTNDRTGSISGGYAAVSTNAATIVNAGSIVGGQYGVEMNGGTLANLSTGTIKGGDVGLYIDSGAVATNAGQLLDDSSAGARLGNDSTLTNLPGGFISGEHGVDFDGANSTLFNAGTIATTEPQGTAIAFLGTGVNYLTLSTGSVIDGIIDGGGTGSQIELTGTGTLGNTIQNFGTTSTLGIASDASWTGTGTWSIATVTNNGTFQAGQLNKPLSLTGDFVQASLATLRVVVTPTLSTQFLITGAAQLAGNLTYVFAPGYYAAHTYDFLTATDGVTGDFANVNYSGYVPPQLTHITNSTPPSANLVLAGNGIVTPADDGVFNAQSQAMADSAQQANTSLLGKASQGAGAGSSAAEACAAEAGAAQNTAAGNATTASRMATAVASAFCGAGGWIEATGTELNADSSGGADDYHADTGGFLAGIDKAVNDSGTRVGLAVGYDETWLHDGGGGKADVSTVRVGLYASQPVGRFTIAADIMYGHGDNHTHRATGIGQANGSYGTNIYSGAVQGSTELFLGPIDVVPAAGVRIAHISSGSFAETGGGFVPAFAVSGNGTDYTSVQPFVNVGLSHSFLSANGMSFTPSLGAGFIYEAGDRGKAVDVTADDFTNFAATHNNLDRATAVISAGIAAGRNNWSLFAHYTAYVSGNWTSQTAEAGLQVKF